MENSPLRSVNAPVRDAMTRRLQRRSVVDGKITLPAVPGMIDQYMSMCESLFATLGRPFNAEQLAHVREVLEGQLAEAYANSPRSNYYLRRSGRHDAQLPRQSRMVDGRGCLRKLDQHHGTATV